jgi:iron complex transport system ATP-binding protein
MSVLQVQDLRLIRQRRCLLSGVSLQVNAGDCLAVLGPNGAGKSSLLKAVSGEWASQGSVYIGGRALASWPRAELARRMAYMTQQGRLGFDFSVRDVLTLGRLPHAGEGLARERAMVDEVIEALGLEALAGRAFPQLSGGEQQRVQFGRALVQLWHQPEGALLLLDEPTSALDLAQQETVFEQLKRLRERGVAVVAVLHDLRLVVQHTSHAVLLRQGEVIGLGRTQEAVNASSVSAAFGISPVAAATVLGMST